MTLTKAQLERRRKKRQRNRPAKLAAKRKLTIIKKEVNHAARTATPAS